MSSLSRNQAQAQCNEADRSTKEVGVLPSFGAAHDTTVFLGRHGCISLEIRHFARQLIAFGRETHTRMHFTSRMPSPLSPEGKAYAATPVIMAIDQEGRVLLVCKYKTKRGLSSRYYWYEQVPRHVSEGRLSFVVRPYFGRINGAATACPARNPSP